MSLRRYAGWEWEGGLVVVVHPAADAGAGYTVYEAAGDRADDEAAALRMHPRSRVLFFEPAAGPGQVVLRLRSTDDARRSVRRAAVRYCRRVLERLGYTGASYALAREAEPPPADAYDDDGDDRTVVDLLAPWADHAG